jgi:hypothetical protein
MSALIFAATSHEADTPSAPTCPHWSAQTERCHSERQRRIPASSKGTAKILRFAQDDKMGTSAGCRRPFGFAIAM